jgi:membrane protease YdiL (CAAX protease family)
MFMASIDLPSPFMPTRRLPRTWYFLGTTIFGVLAYGVTVLAQTLTLVAAMIRYDKSTDADLIAFSYQGGPMAAATVVACPFVLGLLWVATRTARRRFASYLALRWPSRDALVRGLAVTFGFLLIWKLLSYLVGQQPPAFMVDIYRTAKESGSLWLLLIALCVAAPIAEEFAVRGFLFRGWSRSFLGPVGAIVLSSALWAAMHQQYDWYHISQVFLLGLIFGYLRYSSNSTWLTVATHGFFNLAVIVWTAVTVASF